LQSSAKGFVSVMLEKYKDPKASINTAVTGTLRQIHTYCLTLTDLAEDLGAALAHKNPKIKEATAKLLQVFTPPPPSSIKVDICAQICQHRCRNPPPPLSFQYTASPCPTW